MKFNLLTNIKIILFTIFTIPAYANTTKTPNIIAINGSFVVDNCEGMINSNGERTLKNCNFFVRNYADAILEIYDSTGKMVSFYVLTGNRREGVFGDALNSISSTTRGIFDEYKLYDVRDAGARLSKKTTINRIVIPANGKLIITQQSNLARWFNYLSIGSAAISYLPGLFDDKAKRFFKNSFKDQKFINILLANMTVEYTSIGLQWSFSPEGLLENLNENFDEIVLATAKVLTNSYSEYALKYPYSASENFGSFFADGAATIQKTLESLNKLVVAAELIGLGFNIHGQLYNLENATQNNTKIVVDNFAGNFRRFSDLNQYYYDLYAYDEQNGLSIPPKNYLNIGFEKEMFGSSDDLNKQEFFNNVDKLFKLGNPERSEFTTYFDAYTSLKNQIKNSDIPVFVWNDANLLIDTGLKMLFGENYLECIATRKNIIKRSLKIAKKADGFNEDSTIYTKNLYKSGIIETNVNAFTPQTISRLWSLPIYYNLSIKIKLGLFNKKKGSC